MRAYVRMYISRARAGFFCRGSRIALMTVSRLVLSIADLRGGSPSFPLCLYPIPSLKIIFLLFWEVKGGRPCGVRRIRARSENARTGRRVRVTKQMTKQRATCHAPVLFSKEPSRNFVKVYKNVRDDA